MDKMDKKMDKKVGDLEQKSGKNSDVSKENLNYLIYHGRDVRKYNILIMGLNEKSPLEVNDDVANTDNEKLDLILQYLKINDVQVSDMFRIGKGEKPRPLKVIFRNKRTPDTILSNCHHLKDLKEVNIYIRADRTASERKEFDRLNKKEKELE